MALHRHVCRHDETSMVHVAARRKCRPMPTVRSASVANPCGVWTTERVAITRCTRSRPHALCGTCFRCPCQMRGCMGDPQNDSNGKTNAHLRLGQDPRTQHGGHHPQHLSRRHAGGEAGPQTNGRKENPAARRSEEHTSELQSHSDLVCRLLLEKKKKQQTQTEDCSSKHISSNHALSRFRCSAHSTAPSSTSPTAQARSIA